jgi:pimeloyl-ACP methyl ester carboxylesterase
MTYDETRDSEQLRLCDRSIDDFVKRYNKISKKPPARRQTIILFPGGGGCQLKRATTKFIDGISAAQTFRYRAIWLTIGSFLGDALLLRMNKVATGGGAYSYRDKDDYIIVADGAVRLGTFTPYDGFITWCNQKKIDWFVFGWDWRRRLDETVEFFQQQFLPHFQARVVAECGADPLADFSLVGHSFGGMVVNWMLRKHDVAEMKRAVTVATPFYGYAGQIHRFFEGDTLFNGPFDVMKMDVIRTFTSFPAFYALLFLDGDTYDLNKVALQNDPNYPLPDYPSVDATVPLVRADPYDPQTNGAQVRYPPPSTMSGFDPDELANGKAVVKFLAGPLSAARAAKFFNLRGARTTPNTVGGTKWTWLPPPFDPSPIADDPPMPGDGTLPAWSTRLVTLDSGHCIPLVSADVEHMFIMNSALTLAELGTVLGV